MTDFLQDLRDLDRQAWLVIGMVGCGNAILLIGGLEASATFSLIVLSILGFVWVVLLQLTRAIMWSSIELAQESSTEWREEADFSRELLDEHLRTIHDLKQYDLQSSGIHLERLRQTLITRHPELENVIAEVEHPVNVPGFII